MGDKMSWNICPVPRRGHLEAEPAGLAKYRCELDRLTHAFSSEEFADLRVGKGCTIPEIAPLHGGPISADPNTAHQPLTLWMLSGRSAHRSR
jgi:hypothetical protein